MGFSLPISTMQASQEGTVSSRSTFDANAFEGEQMETDFGSEFLQFSPSPQSDISSAIVSRKLDDAANLDAGLPQGANETGKFAPIAGPSATSREHKTDFAMAEGGQSLSSDAKPAAKSRLPVMRSVNERTARSESHDGVRLFSEEEGDADFKVPMRRAFSETTGIERTEKPSVVELQTQPTLMVAGRRISGASLKIIDAKPTTNPSTPLEVAPVFHAPNEAVEFHKTHGSASKASINSAPVNADKIRSQIIAAVKSRPQDGRLEISLDPPELGRVTIEFDGAKNALTRAVIGAELAETSELLRRNIHIFQEALEREGLKGLDLEMREQRRGLHKQNEDQLSYLRPETEIEPMQQAGAHENSIHIEGKLDCLL